MRTRHVIHPQTLPPQRLFLLRPQVGLPVVECHPRLFGELFERLAKVESVYAPVEIEEVTGRLTTETVEEPLLLVDRK